MTSRNLLPGGAEGDAIARGAQEEPASSDRAIQSAAGSQTPTGSGSSPGSADPVGQAPTNFPELPIETQWELWQDGNGIMYFVWMVPALNPDDPPIPMAYQIATSDEYERLLGASDVQVDRTLGAGEFDATGVIVLGSSHMLDAAELSDINPFEKWMEAYRDQAELMPWLRDPELLSLLVGVQLLENRDVTQEELATTEWYQTHSATEVAWLESAALDPEGAKDVVETNRTIVRGWFRDAGVNNPSDQLIRAVADEVTMGKWTETIAREQIDLLADPFREGDLKPKLTPYRNGLDTTSQGEATVRDMIYRWLGPLHAEGYSAQEISALAGSFRNDPDAEDAFVETLKDQRLNLFPQYANREQTYEQIAAPWRQQFFSTWGQQADETDPIFTEIVKLNDAGAAAQLLRSQGLKRGVKTVVDEALGGLLASTGGSLRPSSGAIT